MKENIDILAKMYTELIQSDFVSFSKIKEMTNVMGVYIIFSPERQIIYIGSTNKFNIRFGTDLKHESTHTLVRKLITLNVFEGRKDAVEYLSKKCKFKIQICNTKREAEALEHFAIWTLNPKFNK